MLFRNNIYATILTEAENDLAYVGKIDFFQSSN